MFTGIVNYQARVQAIQKRPSGILELKIMAPPEKLNLKPGASVALDGVCLTLVSQTAKVLIFEAVPETLRLTTLKNLKSGDWVHFEPALNVGEPLGGHIVTGHVQGIAKIIKINIKGASVVFHLSCPKALRKYLINKGSVTLAGVNLTIVTKHDDTFKVALIPFTLQNTQLGQAKVGDTLNLETDYWATLAYEFLASEKR